LEVPHLNNGDAWIPENCGTVNDDDYVDTRVTGWGEYSHLVRIFNLVLFWRLDYGVLSQKRSCIKFNMVIFGYFWAYSWRWLLANTSGHPGRHSDDNVGYIQWEHSSLPVNWPTGRRSTTTEIAKCCSLPVLFALKAEKKSTFHLFDVRSHVANRHVIKPLRSSYSYLLAYPIIVYYVYYIELSVWIGLDRNFG
jgi:hypothetical protein